MDHFQQIRSRVAAAAKQAGRDPAVIRLIAVCKGQPLSKILPVLEQGQLDLGENYAQELLEKAAALGQPEVRWHFLGHLQKNKVGKILGKISLLHSLDSLALAEMIQQKALFSLPCCLEIKLAKDLTKTGLAPEDALELIPRLNHLSKIDLVGLMTIPPIHTNPEKSRPYFQKLSALLQEINRRQLYHKQLTHLSMGMSLDFEVAIAEGATMVRVGTAIFGHR